jgi:hypothetical protein
MMIAVPTGFFWPAGKSFSHAFRTDCREADLEEA